MLAALWSNPDSSRQPFRLLSWVWPCFSPQSMHTSGVGQTLINVLPRISAMAHPIAMLGQGQNPHPYSHTSSHPRLTLASGFQSLFSGFLWIDSRLEANTGICDLSESLSIGSPNQQPLDLPAPGGSLLSVKYPVAKVYNDRLLASQEVGSVVPVHPFCTHHALRRDCRTNPSARMTIPHLASSCTTRESL